MTLLRFAIPLLAAILLLTNLPKAHADAASPDIYQFVVTNIDGKSVPLSKYKGKVLLIVNTASLCGNTPQYASLEKLYNQYKHQGLRILAFPANNFGHQEPGPNDKIKEFCTGTYHVTFDIFSKISVLGEDQAPLYHYLTDKSTDPQYAGDIEWNFAKFLIGRDGKILNRFPAHHDPLLPDVVGAVQTALGQPKTAQAQ